MTLLGYVMVLYTAIIFCAEFVEMLFGNGSFRHLRHLLRAIIPYRPRNYESRCESLEDMDASSSFLCEAEKEKGSGECGDSDTCSTTSATTTTTTTVTATTTTDPERKFEMVRVVTHLSPEKIIAYVHERYPEFRKKIQFGIYRSFDSKGQLFPVPDECIHVTEHFSLTYLRRQHHHHHQDAVMLCSTDMEHFDIDVWVGDCEQHWKQKDPYDIINVTKNGCPTNVTITIMPKKTKAEEEEGEKEGGEDDNKEKREDVEPSDEEVKSKKDDDDVASTKQSEKEGGDGDESVLVVSTRGGEKKSKTADEDDDGASKSEKGEKSEEKSGVETQTSPSSSSWWGGGSGNATK